MNKKYRVRALKFPEGWRPQFTRPEGHVINGIVMLAEVEYPSFNARYDTEEEANKITYDHLIKENVKPEDIEIVSNK